jgi:hypothetical protein
MCGSVEEDCQCERGGHDTMRDVEGYVPGFLREKDSPGHNAPLPYDLEAKRMRGYAKGRTVDGSVINNNRRRTI